MRTFDSFSNTVVRGGKQQKIERGRTIMIKKEVLDVLYF